MESFLTNPAASLYLDIARSDSSTMPNRGTPLAAVIFPLLFSFALLTLVHALNKISSLKNTTYADDFTPWVSRGSEALTENTLRMSCYSLTVSATGAHVLHQQVPASHTPSSTSPHIP
ncbi:hypothetical protein HPB48_015729 [Haemaphysalis longicornis]|uniref:Uncharacterized protein n=1 Tax=Haemaphysalis longicornis TaxID=44386 RepID=A0A9J6G7R2_HAELO|nr:hypothetical protein HPB48_015729 [Haemaphysalis longicornis]